VALGVYTGQWLEAFQPALPNTDSQWIQLVPLGESAPVLAAHAARGFVRQGCSFLGIPPVGIECVRSIKALPWH